MCVRLMNLNRCASSLTFQTTLIPDRILEPICTEWVDTPGIPGNQPHHLDENCILRRKVVVLFCPRIKIQHCTHRYRIYYRRNLAI